MAAAKRNLKGFGKGAGQPAPRTRTGKQIATPRGKKAGVKAFKRSSKPLLVLGRGDGRPNRAAGGTAG